MDFSRFLTIKDFFNYYIAGTIWIADILLLINMKNSSIPDHLLYSSCKSGSIPWIQTIFEVIIIVILPYTVGFALGTLSAKITKELRNKKCVGDPIKWITDDCDKHEGKRFPKPARDKIFNDIAPRIFDYTLTNKQLWFYQIRAYVVDKGGPAVVLSERAQSLANFTESLILPFPILCAIVTWITITGWHYDTLFIAYSPNQPVSYEIMSWKIIEWYCGALVIALSVWLAMSWMLFNRYLELRREWAMHIYREFLVIAADKNNSK